MEHAEKRSSGLMKSGEKLAKAIIKEFAFFIINGETIWSRCSFLLFALHNVHTLVSLGVVADRLSSNLTYANHCCHSQ